MDVIIPVLEVQDGIAPLYERRHAVVRRLKTIREDIERLINSKADELLNPPESGDAIQHQGLLDELRNLIRHK